MVRLTNTRIAWLVRGVTRGRERVATWAAQWGVSKRHLQRLARRYKETGVIPTLNPHRRPKGPALSIQDQEWIEKGRQATQRGATKIYHWLRTQGIVIPKHKIHAYATARRWSTPNPRKQRKRSRARYERDHSGSLLHGDWHRTSVDHPHAIIWIDDASRYALSGGELDAETAAVCLVIGHRILRIVPA